MGFPQCTCYFQEPPSPDTCAIVPSTTNNTTNTHFDDQRFKKLLHKMIWEFGLSCFFPKSLNSCKDKKNDKNCEHNKAWLLAETAGTGAELTNADPHSVHSSFRFSFCSQIELESMKKNNSCSATVLMVNLDNGLIESRSKELKWSRIESLERSISPVVQTLVRFSFDEILYATHNFSKGINLLYSFVSYPTYVLCLCLLCVFGF